MCGIAGIAGLRPDAIDPAAVKRMCDTLIHRGPDDAGYAFFQTAAAPGRDGFWCRFCDPAFQSIHENLPVFGSDYCRRELADRVFALGLGHRRLAVLDTTPCGHQPMFSEDRRYCIVHNGEVYNFRELRADLERRGRRFRTRTDTEVLLALWADYGPDCLPLLDGMFAFALYDRVDNALWLARDRFGVKPLYYAAGAGAFVFASECKALFASGLVEPAIEPAALVEYFTFQNLCGAHTIWRGVSMLQPGEALAVRPGDGGPAIRRYHDAFPEMDPSLGDEESVAGTLAQRFEDAVTAQLVSDVPVGSYLSGGMDSGSIVAVAGQAIERLHTFTGGFDLTNVDGIEQGFDERKLAEQLSYLLQTEHYDVVLHSGDMPAAMERLTWHMDDPRVGMCHQNWYVAKLASRFVKVCLAGTGGDELFAGYPWRYRLAECRTLDRFDRRYFRYWHRLLAPDELPGLFAPDLRGHGLDAWESFRGVLRAGPAWRDDVAPEDNLLQRALHFEFRTFLHGLLIVEDRISMAHSLETRVPFLDNRLADLAWRIPPALKLHRRRGADPATDGHLESAAGKHVLRRAMESYLPEVFVKQKKRGFSPPDANWYRGPSMDYIKSVLFDRTTRERPWFDQAFVESRLDEHFEGRRNHRLLIWSLLSVEAIQRHFVDAGRAAAATRPLGAAVGE